MATLVAMPTASVRIATAEYAGSRQSDIMPNRKSRRINVEDLALIDLPGGPGGESAVAIRQRLRTGERVERSGRVVGLVDRLDPQTRRAELLVLIDDPLDAAGGLPLLPGSSVDGEM